MRNSFKDLIKHSAVYGFGQVLSRMASFLLLPLYTRYLTPADYGVIALLDFASTILAILIGAGMAQAVTRYHFDATSEDERNSVWWTGLTFLLCMSTTFLLVGLLFREGLAELTLGGGIEKGGFFFALILPTMWVNVVGQFLHGYIRVRKWSTVSVAVSQFRLFLNIGLNVYFLAVMDLSITGILLGNLIAGAVVTFTFFVLFLRSLSSYSFHQALVAKLWRFGGPLIANTLLGSALHQGNRYILRYFVDMDQVGIYSVALGIGQGVYFLYMLPFSMIWNVMMYEIAEQSDSRMIFSRVFEYVSYGLALLLLGISIFANTILEIMTTSEYMPAAELIPPICLAYLLYSLHEHFKVPVLLAKRTVALLPVSGLAVCANIGLNMLMIPILGTVGAAWASVGTFVVYSFVGLYRFRKIDAIKYPFKRFGLVLTSMILSLVMFQSFVEEEPTSWITLGMGALVWVFWLVAIFGLPLRNLLKHNNLEDIKKVFQRKGQGVTQLVGGGKA